MNLRRQALLYAPLALALCVALQHESMSVASRGAITPALGVHRWAIATLITMSANKALSKHAITYTHQAMLLAYQMRERYPDIPLLAVVLKGQVGPDDTQLLQQAGYQVLLKESLIPAYVTSIQALAPVYHDQYMKFWLWQETAYEYIVYIDSDTFFRNPSAIHFELSFPHVSEQQVVACPTPWSHASNSGQAITWNGGFFIMKPSRRVFELLAWSTTMPTHFVREYGQDKQWFDVSEMGAFMRELPTFSTPIPLQEDYCSETLWCCVDIQCQPQFNITPTLGNMIHGLKPEGLRAAGAPPSSIFDNQRLNVFATWGYDPACLLTAFYEPLLKLYTLHGLGRDIK